MSSHRILAQQNACDYSVEGQVLDLTSGKPIPFATIQIKGSDKGEAADENGFFKIENICDEEFNLVITHLGYKPISHHHDIFHESPRIFLAEDEVVLESLIVEGKSIPGDLISSTSSELTSRDLSLVQSESFGDIASEITGVNTISTGQNIVKPVIHGLHSNRVLVINNGLRHEFQNWGTDHAPEIDPSLFDNLQVIKGAATVRYGPDALGGVILINPAPIELSSHLHGEARLTGASNGRSGEGTLKLQKGFKYFGVTGETSWLKQGDLRAPDYNLSNTGKSERSYSGGVRIHPIEAIDLNVYYSHFQQELGILRGGINGNLDNLIDALEGPIPNDTGPFRYGISTPKQNVTHNLLKLQASYADQTQTLSIQYGRQFNHRREFSVRRNDEIPNINLELVTNSFDLDWNHPKIGPLNGKFGFQWVAQENDNIAGTNTIPFIPNYESDRFGFYLIESLESGENTFEAGIRYDDQKADVVGRDRRNDIFRNRISYKNATVTLGLHRELNEQESIRINFGTAWRPPNVAELYRFGQHLLFTEYGLWRYDFNENDEITTTRILTEDDRPAPSEVGFKWTNNYELRKENFQLEATAYANYIQNFIFTRPGGLTLAISGPTAFFIYEQGDALLWGTDLSARYNHSEKIESTFKGSYLWSKQIDENDFFIGQPPAKLGYELSYTPTISFFSQSELRLFLDYTFRQFQAPRTISAQELIDAQSLGIELFGEDASNFDILDPPSGYFLTDLSWTSSIKQFEFNFRVKNVFNVSYRNYTDRIRYFADEVGRNFILSLIYRL